jgi:hypothetical protein
MPRHANHTLIMPRLDRGILFPATKEDCPVRPGNDELYGPATPRGQHATHTLIMPRLDRGILFPANKEDCPVGAGQ